MVFVSAEVAPWSKAGGLGDVMDALPTALAARGVPVVSVSPAYQPYTDTVATGVTIPLQHLPPPPPDAEADAADLLQASLRAVVADGVLRVFVQHPLLAIPPGANIYSTYTMPDGSARSTAAAMQVRAHNCAVATTHCDSSFNLLQLSCTRPNPLILVAKTYD